MKETMITVEESKHLMKVQKMNRLLDNKLTFFVDWRYFGYKEAVALHKVRKDRMSWLNECYRFLQEEFRDWLNDYKLQEVLPVPYSELPENLKTDSDLEHPYIWVCWFQCEENMPEVVRVCIDSIRKNAPKGVKVVLITLDNVCDYVEFPDFILKKVKQGKISITHFSDVLRFSLLKKYGGLWIDSTVYVSRPIPVEYMKMPLYSIQNLSNEERYKNIYYGGCASFLIGGGGRKSPVPVLS